MCINNNCNYLNKNESVCICGGGHQGIAMAAHLSLNGVKVSLWNRSFDHIKKIIETKKILCDGVVQGVANIDNASTDISQVIEDFIMITTPSTAHRDIARRLAPFIHKDMVIVLNPGRTFGAVEFAEELKNCGIKELPHIAETQTIIYTCRKKDDNSATIFAFKYGVAISSLQGDDIMYIMDKMPLCIKDMFNPVHSILSTSLSNVGMILHCAPVLMNIGWIENNKVDFKYYYEGISMSIAKYLEKMDSERLAVSSALNCPIESVRDWLKRIYHVNGTNIYECIKNNVAYNEIDAPPTIHTRYILEDVPNGLVPIEELAKSLDIATPNISTIIDLASSVLDIDFRKIGRKYSFDEIQEYIF